MLLVVVIYYHSYRSRSLYSMDHDKLATGLGQKNTRQTNSGRDCQIFFLSTAKTATYS